MRAGGASLSTTQVCNCWYLPENNHVTTNTQKRLERVEPAETGNKHELHKGKPLPENYKQLNNRSLQRGWF